MRAARTALRVQSAALAALALAALAAPARAGSEAASAQAGGTLVVAPALRELLVALVSDRAGVEANQVVVPSLNDFRLPAEQAAAAEVDLSVHESADFSGPTSITIVMKQGDAVLKRGVVSVHVKRPQRILVAAQRIARGDIIEERDIEWREVPESRVPREAVSDPQEILGRTAARSITAGQAWRSDLVTDPPLVARGELVRVRIETGPLQIDALCEARSDGRVGERLRVLNPDSKREIVGILAADGVVHVHF
jgi:flagella basal body P-ring formation protein FlgA